MAGDWSPTYRFDEGVLTDADVSLTAEAIRFGDTTISLQSTVPEGWQAD